MLLARIAVVILKGVLSRVQQGMKYHKLDNMLGHTYIFTYGRLFRRAERCVSVLDLHITSPCFVLELGWKAA